MMTVIFWSGIPEKEYGRVELINDRVVYRLPAEMVAELEQGVWPHGPTAEHIVPADGAAFLRALVQTYRGSYFRAQFAPDSER